MNRFYSLLVTSLLVVLCSTTVASLKDKATGIQFADKVNGLDIVGVGVRSKGPIKVYSVGCYGPKGLKKSLEGFSLAKDKKNALETLNKVAQQGPVTFLLKFNYKVGAEKISSSISDAIASRYSGSNDIGKLKSLLCNGVNQKGSTEKGTTMQFDCSSGGIKVSLDGQNLGTVSGGGIAKAFCNVYLDGKAVSPTLRESCIENCCQS